MTTIIAVMGNMSHTYTTTDDNAPTLVTNLYEEGYEWVAMIEKRGVESGTEILTNA
jgi:hypothetical protein